MCDNEPLCTVLLTILNVSVKPWITVKVGVDTKKKCAPTVLEASERPATTQQHGRTAHCVLLSRAEWPNLYCTMFVQ